MKRNYLILIVLFAIAYLLRVMYLPQNALTFGYDQARDHLQAQAIINGDLKIQGPSASTPGLHHGVLWFYYLVPPTLLSGGNPVMSAYWNALFNAAVIFIVYALTNLFVKDRRAGLFAAVLYAVSFEASQYATWLSNPTIGAWSVPMLYLGLWLWIQEKKPYAPIIAAVGLGISIHANIFLAYHIVPVCVWLWAKRKNITIRQLATSFVAFLIVLSPMIVSEIKFGFRSVSGFVSLLSSQDAVIASKQLGDFIILFFNQIGKVYAYNSYPGNIGYGGMLVIILIITTLVSWQNEKKNRSDWKLFISTWLLAHTTVVTVGGASTPFLLVGIGPAVSIILGIYLSKWWNGYKVVSVAVLALLIMGNLMMIRSENPKGQTIFAIQKDMLLSRQIQAIDYTYQEAQGKDFSINTLTSPLWINIVWTYLYEWYGYEHYGYLPTWHGAGQEGQLDSLESSLRTDPYFVIIEPLGGIPPRYKDELLTEEGYFSDVTSEQVFGKELIVQKRIIK